MTLNRHDEAATCYGKLISLYPGDFDNWNKRAVAYFLAGDLENAKNTNVEFISHFPVRDEPQIHQGNVFLAQGDTTQAMSYFKRALEINPSNAAFENHLKTLRIN